MNTPLTPEQWWNGVADIHQLRTIKHWLEEELNISVDEITDIEIRQDMIEKWLPDGLYKTFRPGKFNCFTITLIDGSKIYRSFRRGE